MLDLLHGQCSKALIGTQFSGISFQLGGLPLCLATAGLMALASLLAARRLKSV